MKNLFLAFVCLISIPLVAQNLVKEGATVKKLAGDLKFTEGPIADAKGDVYFSDIPPRIIYKWSEKNGLSVFKDDVPGCNGLFFDGDSNLVVCGNSQAQNMWKMNIKTGKQEVITAAINGIKYNSPNDLWIDKKGGIYFTDPRYGKRAADAILPESESVYYIEPDTKNVIEVISDFVKPNGIIATPNGKTLYLADIGGGKVYAYTIKKDGTLKNKTLFAEEACDGMTMDENGNLYFTNDAVKVYSPDGVKLTEIVFPERPANVCFGGADRKTLYVTARTGFYAIDMNVAGAY